MKLEKKLGVRENCPSCHSPMVCAEIEYQGVKKLQWQNEDGKAHYAFDFKTKTTSCAKNHAQVAQKLESVTRRNEIHLKDLKLSVEQLAAVANETNSMLDTQLARIYFIEESLRAKGIEPTGPFVGMLYNQQMESLRTR